MRIHAYALDGNIIMSPPNDSSNRDTATDKDIPFPTTANTNLSNHLHQNNYCSGHFSYAPSDEDETITKVITEPAYHLMMNMSSLLQFVMQHR